MDDNGVQGYHFYPRSPCGERRYWQDTRHYLTTYFYPRSPCGERRVFLKAEGRLAAISIHALLAESDSAWIGAFWTGQSFLSTLSLRRATTTNSKSRNLTVISIHALLAESDAAAIAAGVLLYQFLSTLSLRRATCLVLERLLFYPNFYPRSPCGERREYVPYFLGVVDISIHALLAESDRLMLETMVR